MTIVAGVDVGNATTEIVLVRHGPDGPAILAAGRVPTRGRKGSAESLRAAAALLRRLERQARRSVAEARIAAPLRPVDTFVESVPAVAPSTGRLRVLAAGVATPGGTGTCVGVPFTLPAGQPAASPGTEPIVVLIPAGVRHDEAALRVSSLISRGARVGAVLVAGDEGVLVANRLPARIPVIDQADVPAAAACELIAVEVRPAGHPMTTVGDPVALAAAFRLGEAEAADAATVGRSVLDYSNAAVGLAAGWPAAPPAAAPMADPLAGPLDCDDVLTVDLAAAAEAATARRGRLGRARLIAVLRRYPPDGGVPAAALAAMTGIPVTAPLSEPAAAWLGASTTPGIRPGALVADFGAGTVDLIAPGGEAVVAGAGDLLTAAVSQLLGVPRAAADWIKRGPAIRVDGTRRYEAEDGTRGFLDVPAPAAAAGLLAVPGPGGLLPFSTGLLPAGEWRALRLRLKQATLGASLARAADAAGLQLEEPVQLILAGGPAGDDELVGVLTRALPQTVIIGRASVGGSLPADARAGTELGHRYAAALGLALA
jgi:hypothetical protein